MTELNPGDHLGIYELVSKLEVGGGMSTAYKARVSGSNHYVALKVVPAKCPSGHDVRKWERRVEALELEASICNSLGTHPNIVRFHGEGKTEDWNYLGFDFVEGEDLEVIIESRSSQLQEVIPVKRAVEITKKVADGLQHIHRKGIVHKDIKSGNILIDERTVKIIDFGLSYDTNNIDDNLKCEPNIFLGTVEYAPPEYVHNFNPHPQGDIYSLGATLFHMLTGETPFETVKDTLLTRFYYDLIDFSAMGARLSSLAPHVPEDVKQVCLIALEKNLDMRYRSAKKFSDALTDVLKEL